MQREFSERQRVREEIDLFKFREKHTPQTECGPSQKVSAVMSVVAMRCGMLTFYGLGNFIC